MTLMNVDRRDGWRTRTLPWPALCVALLLLGCPAGDDDDASDDDTADDDDNGDDDADIDCDDLPPLPTAYEFFPDIAPSEDFTFDDQGNMVHVSFGDGGFRRTTYDGEFELILPGASTWPRGTRMLLDGDVALGDPDLATLMRLTFDGSKTPIASGLNNINGVAIRDDGMIFATTGPTGSPDDAPNAEVWMIDPTAGNKQIVYELPDASFDGIVFGLDYETLYVNNEYDGKIYRMTVSEAGEASGFELWLQLSLTADRVDAMTIDVCGNLYVVKQTFGIARVTPSGEVDEIDMGISDAPLASTNFGSGIGGWEDDHLYVQSYGGAYELDIGVPGRPEPFLAQ